MPGISVRQALCQLCCSARGAGNEGGLPLPRPLLQEGVSRSETRKATRIFRQDIEQPGTSLSIEYKSHGDDADTFDDAVRDNNYAALVRLLQSEQAVEILEPKHPWAEDPCTIGALAAMQLALLTSVVAKDDPEMKLEIHGAGAVPPLVGFLRSNQEDRVQAAVTALKYLTEECPQSAHSAHQAGALPPLIMQLGSPLAGLRGAAASTLKNICVECPEHQEEFMRLGGLKFFVEHLELVSDPMLFDHPDLMLEAVWNLEEVTTDPDGNLNERYAQLANQCGALEKLEKLRGIGDDEVSGAAEKVMERLRGA